MKFFHDLYNKKMDRREFLTFVGLFLFLISGISGIIKNLKSEGLFGSDSDSNSSSSSFGNGAYGGAGKRVS